MNKYEQSAVMLAKGVTMRSFYMFITWQLDIFVHKSRGFENCGAKLGA